jgi:uncharacterized repeat protein (TIGR04076 family)
MVGEDSFMKRRRFMTMKGKITVLKRIANQDLAEEFRKGDYNKRYPVPCNLFEDGQEFILENMSTPPEGFCNWAWIDIHRGVVQVLSGGNNGAIKQKGSTINCCTDGFRPVVFKIERID